MSGADQDHAAVHVADQADAPQDKGAHDDLTDVRFARHHSAKVGALDPHDPALRSRPSGHQDLTIVEQVEFACELALAEHRECVGRATRINIVDFDSTFEHQEKVDGPLASLEDGGSLGNASSVP